ncbi:MAG TPA: nucleoside recognition domain-containing protein [Phycisphaerae bacterium]|nr:nucleoside recognition domain-containing protein [Phycisphaerae bacterium]HOJ73657.1 nucleoside recognition domain-containing protein [Phycisphaerae bacterium]HOM50304.1 nucleoside recognition domain-containing protein [Phycisphaerae bacterium]HON68642.1 nucleoside recognition domain-containing protein [Phycisphaerae bacterium]HOQ84854.1 nucleoside recognition domain-containing protein [Phycisphaerae bacterium]
MNEPSLFKLIIDQISLLTVPLLFFAIVAFAMWRGVKAYESFITGGKEGFNIFLQILPYLVAIFVAIGVFRVSGALDYISDALAPVTTAIGMPPEVLPTALMRPLSGSGSLGLASDVIEADPDSFNAKVASTVFGATDTTFYVIALYFGSVGIRKIRHAMIAGLLADLAGILAAVAVCHLVFK